ncbi:MAG: spore germination protein [Clostridia bacterium]|nr:spore germination protein [Clostridia bacterium]
MENKTKITENIIENRKYIENALQAEKNFDLKIRDFKVKFNDGYADGFLIFFDGMVNKTFINRDIMRGLLSGVSESLSAPRKETIFEKMTPLAPFSIVYDFEKALEDTSFGHCLVFVDGCACAFAADVKGWNGRSVGQPISEASLSGPQEAFNEIMMTNLALIRKIMKTPDLIAENISVGKESNTPCALLYLNGVTNKELVAEIKNRLENIDVSFVFSSGDIEMLIEDKTFFPMTHTLKTERPDRASAMLAEGKVIILVQGSPFAISLPTTAADLIEASEDNYVRVSEANFMRFVRISGILLSLFLPGLFVAVLLYHQELLPTDLLLAIEATREVVPFPLVLELILMILAFELIKEASVRVPSPVGSTLGIIGGLILGQAAVEANIVSPLLIIIVSIAGLGAFATPSVSFSRSLSLMQFIYVILGAFGGLLGIICGFFISVSVLAASESFQVPFLSPIAPKNGDSVWDSLLIKPIWKKERRPKNLQTQNPIKQPHISRKWLRR